MMIKPISEYVKKSKRRKDNNYHLNDGYKGHAIYAISEGLSGCIKVGKSNQLYKRMQQYRTSTPAEVQLEGAAFLEDPAMLSHVERETHRLLRDAGCRVRGEWFVVDLHTLRDMVATACENTSAKVEKLIGVFRPPEPNEFADYADRFPDFVEAKHKFSRPPRLGAPYKQ